MTRATCARCPRPCTTHAASNCRSVTRPKLRCSPGRSSSTAARFHERSSSTPAAALLAVASSLHAQRARLDSLHAYVQAQMARRHISGLSLAIIQDGNIVVARGYGVTDESTRGPVTAATLFQAGSISKPVSALGALHLVEAGRLTLDGDVNAYLTSWKVPENAFTTTEKVTLRRLLSHSARVPVH